MARLLTSVACPSRTYTRYGTDMLAFILLFLISISSFQIKAVSPLPLVCDVIGAREWCDTTALHPIEGIWIYPEDNVTVLVRRLPDSDRPAYRKYDICVIDTPDCSMTPGESIGILEATADSKSFRLRLFTKRKKGILTGLTDCAARLADEENLRVETPKFKFRLGSLSVLPKFWRMVRVSIDNPASRLPAGMVRIYPSYDGNGSSRSTPRYL
ncbi:MAG: hypothetical protein K2H47_09580 [Muribaculaceae bacterium]|nr:hypothetical protein [Muribaculaceae bacterium]